MRDGVARRLDGILAGSVLTIDEAVRNLVASGADWKDAVRAASTAPARLLAATTSGGSSPARSLMSSCSKEMSKCRG